MSIQRNDWSLQRKGIIDQERHKDRVKEAIRKNLGSIVSNEAIILSNAPSKFPSGRSTSTSFVSTIKKPNTWAREMGRLAWAM
jgi:hypothetical protein